MAPRQVAHGVRKATRVCDPARTGVTGGVMLLLVRLQEYSALAPAWLELEELHTAAIRGHGAAD